MGAVLAISPLLLLCPLAIVSMLLFSGYLLPTLMGIAMLIPMLLAVANAVKNLYLAMGLMAAGIILAQLLFR
jgi:hypothetical protein